MPKTTLIQPDKTLRRRVLWALLLMFCLAIWGIASFTRYTGTLQRSADPQDMERLLILLKWIVLSLPVFAFALSGWLFWLAKRIFQTGQFPLPGQRVIKPTPLRTGEAARRLAWMLITLGTTLICVELAMTYYAMGVLRLFNTNLESHHVPDPVRLPRPSPL